MAKYFTYTKYETNDLSDLDISDNQYLRPSTDRLFFKDSNGRYRAGPLARQHTGSYISRVHVADLKRSLQQFTFYNDVKKSLRRELYIKGDELDDNINDAFDKYERYVEQYGDPQEAYDAVRRDYNLSTTPQPSGRVADIIL